MNYRIKIIFLHLYYFYNFSHPPNAHFSRPRALFPERPTEDYVISCMSRFPTDLKRSFRWGATTSGSVGYFLALPHARQAIFRRPPLAGAHAVKWFRSLPSAVGYQSGTCWRSGMWAASRSTFRKFVDL